MYSKSSIICKVIYYWVHVHKGLIVEHVLSVRITAIKNEEEENFSVLYFSIFCGLGLLFPSLFLMKYFVFRKGYVNKIRLFFWNVLILVKFHHMYLQIQFTSYCYEEQKWSFDFFETRNRVWHPTRKIRSLCLHVSWLSWLTLTFKGDWVSIELCVDLQVDTCFRVNRTTSVDS